MNMWWRGVLPCRAVLVPVPCACGVWLTVTRPRCCVAPIDRCQRPILGRGRRLQQNREGAADCRREPQQHQHGALRDGGAVQRCAVSSHVWLFTRQAGKSLLHICAEKGYARTAMMLIDASADIGALSPVRGQLPHRLPRLPPHSSRLAPLLTPPVLDGRLACDPSTLLLRQATRSCAISS